MDLVRSPMILKDYLKFNDYVCLEIYVDKNIFAWTETKIPDFCLYPGVLSITVPKLRDSFYNCLLLKSQSEIPRLQNSIGIVLQKDIWQTLGGRDTGKN